MLNQTIDPFIAEIIKNNPGLKQAYETMLLQEIRLRELNAKTNYTAIKTKIIQSKQKDKDKLQNIEKF